MTVISIIKDYYYIFQNLKVKNKNKTIYSNLHLQKIMGFPVREIQVAYDYRTHIIFHQFFLGTFQKKSKQSKLKGFV